MTISVIVIEDDEDLCDTLCRYLSRCGMRVRGAPDAESLWLHLDQAPADVLVLDLNLPGENGFSVAARLQENSRAGLIILTARSFREDRLQGLALGADHYLLKPVDLQELEATIRNLARRVLPTEATEVNEGAGELWQLHCNTWHLIAPNRRSLLLTAVEYRVLHCLGRSPGTAFTRAQILEALQRPDIDIYRRNLDTTVSRLRKRVEEDCGVAPPIRAARGIGYAFVGRIELHDTDPQP